jgi:uncharacterized protein
MGWEIFWPLVLGFALSGIVQAVVTKGEMSRLLPDSSARTILIASGLGAASSSCSYVGGGAVERWYQLRRCRCFSIC